MAEQKVELRRIRDFSENLNDTILFIRQNFKPLLTCFLGIAGIFMLTSAVLNGIYQSRFGGMLQDIISQRSNGVSVRAYYEDNFLIAIVTWLNYVAMQVAVISYIKVYEIKDGETPVMSEVWQVFKRCFFKVFFYNIPIALLTVLGFIFCVLPCIYLAVVFVPFTAILIIEGASFGDAFSRCFRIIKDNFWVSLGIYFLTYLISAICGSSISLIIGAIGGIISYFTTRDLAATFGIVISLLNIFSFIFYIVYYVSITLHYFNLAERHDGTGMMKKLDSIGDSGPDFDNIQEQY